MNEDDLEIVTDERGKGFQRYTFALDDIVKGILVRNLALCQGKDQFLVVTRQHQAFKGAVVPFDLPNGADTECHCKSTVNV